MGEYLETHITRPDLEKEGEGLTANHKQVRLSLAACKHVLSCDESHALLEEAIMQACDDRGERVQRASTRQQGRCLSRAVTQMH